MATRALRVVICSPTLIHIQSSQEEKEAGPSKEAVRAAWFGTKTILHSLCSGPDLNELTAGDGDLNTYTARLPAIPIWFDENSGSPAWAKENRGNLRGCTFTFRALR